MIEIRKVTNNDFENLALIKPSITKETFVVRLEKQQGSQIEFLILLSDSEPVCFLVMSPSGKSTHPQYPDLYDLYTRENFRGKGYMSMLIHECENRARKLGFKKIGLAVNPTLNVKAKELYEKLGYKNTGEPTYLDGIYNGTEDWVIDLEKEL